MVHTHGPHRQNATAAPDSCRHRPLVFRQHSSVRGWRWTHWSRYCREALSEGLGQPTLTALSLTIHRARKSYYEQLERSSSRNEITDWLFYFATIVLAAQAEAQRLVDFIIAKAKFYDRQRDQFNERQEKAIARLMREGPAGFEGGLSAKNYIAITGASRATATRDLQDLVAKGALTQTGELEGAR